MYVGTNLNWNYAKHTFLLTMDKYISNLCIKFSHPDPKKPQKSLYKYTLIQYGSKVQYSKETPDSPHLNYAGILHVQSIVGYILQYACAVDKKILVALIEIGQQQASATESTNEAIEQLLYYVTTYPNDGITYQSSDIFLSGHSYADYLNVRKYCSQAVSHIMLSKNVPVPNINVPVLPNYQIRHVFHCRRRTSRTVRLCQRNGTPLSDPNRN